MSIRTVLLNVVVAGGYWLIAELALMPATAAGPITPFWPSAGVALAAVLLLGWRVLPGVGLGSCLVSGARIAALPMLTVAAGVVLEAAVAVLILRRLRFDERFERVRDPLVLGLVAAPVAALLSATTGTAGTYVGLGFPSDDLFYTWMLWWSRDWLGATLVGSLILTWARARGVDWTPGRTLEAGALAAATVIALTASVSGAFGLQNLPIAFVFVPIVGWAGLRFGPRGATLLAAVVGVLLLPVTAAGGGPFGSVSLGAAQFLLHIFLMLGSLGGLVLGGVMAEREADLERKRALEEQLRHSQKMEAVGRLAGGIAHDFNNLLTAILGYNEIVLHELEPGDPRRGDAEEIGRAAMRAADLTRQMLAFSRRQILTPKVIDLNTSLTKVEPMLRRVIGEDIVMTITPKAEHPMARVDPGQIEQVVMNLVVNARDAMPKGGRLTVETGDASVDAEAAKLNPDARPGDYVMLAVSDTGVGMSAEVRNRIFEPYFTTKEVGKGTGLGLSTAYGIVRQSEGFIGVYSEPGLGTTFRVYLPREEEEATAAEADDGARMPGGTEHILLVEDDTSVRRLTKEILSRAGYSVTEAASGRAGLALGSDDTRHFDLALCDVILGDMSGPAVVEALRALRPSIRVVYMSGYTDEAIVRTGVLDEGQPFLQKPFTPTDLTRKIREVLDHHEE